MILNEKKYLFLLNLYYREINQIKKATLSDETKETMIKAVYKKIDYLREEAYKSNLFNK